MILLHSNYKMKIYLCHNYYVTIVLLGAAISHAYFFFQLKNV